MMLIRTTAESVKFIGSKYIQESLINTTLTRPDYFLFLQESQAKVLTNQSKHLFQNKNKRPRCIKVGNGPLKYSLCGKYCNYLLTTTQSDRFASCEHFVSLSQTWSIPPWNKPILDIPKSERSIVYRIPTENGPWRRSSSTAYPDGRRMTFFIFSFVSFGTGCFGKEDPESFFPRRYLYKIGSPSNCLR